MSEINIANKDVRLFHGKTKPVDINEFNKGDLYFEFPTGLVYVFDGFQEWSEIANLSGT